MARAIRGTNVRVHDLRSLTAAGRIVHEILRLAGRGRTSGNLARIKLQPAPTQAEIVMQNAYQSGNRTGSLQVPNEYMRIYNQRSTNTGIATPVWDGSRRAYVFPQ